MALPNYAQLGFKEILVRLEDGVAIVTLNRAKQRNTFSQSLTYELVKAFDLFDKDDRVRVVVFTAEPTAPAFCAGADISKGWDMMFTPGTEGPHAHRDTGGMVALAILRCRKITVVAVNGHAAGVGVTGFQVPFDFRFAWEGAKLSMPFVRRGIAAEGENTVMMPSFHS
ncbi:hypothetical protein EUX98_g2671 [Antrodiella citrinella]|uniref:3-hydroxyisobutyryl-CoA hydrolase n=1 Tax=Antrodiella citrinella TaxID=2447956 RepID=A0A4S4MYF9_9APHY|nr:hypothetical protein EUX98_g2671 [Antrodiella citrinella]